MLRRRSAHRVSPEQNERRTYIRIPIQDIYVGTIHARSRSDEMLVQLAASIARHGLLQPVVVRKNEQAERYALVCGARRLEACKMLGMKEIDALCLEIDETTAVACLMEDHALRCSPCAIEEATALSGVNREDLFACTALPHALLEQRLTLLSLPLPVREISCQCGLSAGQIQPILSIPTEERQMEAVRIIAERALTPAQAQRLVHGSESFRKPFFYGRRRIFRTILEEMNTLVNRIRAQGIDARISVHAQEDGMCIQLRIVRQEKQAGQQELGKKRRNS